jgi:hypothetical protein
MHGPRLTEERLRNYLDGDQPSQERMCLALLPLLGPFTQCLPRRPKGGPDGARDIECICNEIVTWGAVGFRNGGGNDSRARSATQAKFRNDLDAALKEDPGLTSFVFFTNVDLTPDQKDGLAAYGRKKSVTTIRIFDLEVLRNVLDSGDGLLVRQQYLGIRAAGDDGWIDWKIPQSSKIATYEVLIRLKCCPDGTMVDAEYFENFSDNLNRFLAYAFAHTCVTTEFDDFVFILSLERGAWASDVADPGYMPFFLSLHCHITAFVWAFEEWCQCCIEGKTERLSSRLRGLPGDQTLDIQSQFGEFRPHRIYRSGAKRVTIEDLSGKTIPMDRPVATSTLLRLLAVANSSSLVIWDDADACPDMKKVLRTLGRINDAGHFAWDHFEIDRDNPERWQFVGAR